MAGVTDAPFRRIAWRYGAGYVVSEMLASRQALWNTTKSRLRRRSVAGIRPVAVQVAGGDPEWVAAAARRHELDGAEIIDINFGCPAKKVCRKAAGSALLADPGRVRRIIAATVAAVGVPVTIKMRTGVSPSQRNGVEIARIAEGEGVAAIAVHGRTRDCRFVGSVEYDTIARIKAATSIPVFANGDIGDAEAAHRVMSETGADGVLIGRAALGAPWLPGQIAGSTGALTLAERLGVVLEHLGEAHEFYGQAGVRIMRKHVQWYLENMTDLGSADWRRAQIGSFNVLTEPSAQLEFIAGLHSAGPRSGSRAA